MSLSDALTSAKSSIGNASAQTALVSRNIANVNNPNATRKFANVSTSFGGGAHILSIARSGNEALYRNMLQATSALGSSNIQSEMLNRIRETIGDVDQEGSPAAAISQLRSVLTAFSVTPENRTLAGAAVDAARDVANGLNQATDTVQSVRQDADAQLSAAAGRMNELLATLETVNHKVMRGTQAGTDITDALDERDQIVSELAEYVGLSTQIRPGNDLVVYTDSGLTLFERTPRKVEFTPTATFEAKTVGSSFRIDGVPVNSGGSSMPIRSGKVFGLLQARDETLPMFQLQLDEIARGLIETFVEIDEGGGTPTRVTGLFTAVGSATVPAAGAYEAGLAGRLRISARVDPLAGPPAGNPFLIRDGVNVDYNAADASGFPDRLNDLIAGMSAAGDFDPSAAIGTQQNLMDYAAASMGWLEGQRSDAMSDAEYRVALLTRTQESLSDTTGINLEEEMSHLLDLERSYQASAKLLTTVGELLDTLIASVR